MERITGTDAANLIEAYAQVYASQEEVVELTEEQVQEDFENWVNSLVEEGYDLSEYSWENMYEEYLAEIGVNFGGQAAVDRVRAQARAQQQQQSASDARIAALRQQRFGGGGSPSARPAMSAKPTPAAQGSQYNMKNLGAAQYAAFKGGGGDAAIKQGYSAGEVVARGRAAINRADGGPRNVGAERAAQIKGSPVVGPRTAAPARPVAQAAKPATPTPATPTPAAPARTFNPLMQRTFGYQTGNAPDQIAAASAGAPPTPSGTALGAAANPDVRKKLNLPAKNLNQDLDLFDVIKGHLLDEGYADSEEAALTIMANMSEEWKQSILEVVTTTGERAPKAVPSQMFPGRPFMGANKPFQEPFVNPSGDRGPVDRSLFKGASKPVKKDTKTA